MYSCTCELESCQLFLENPIVLPCGTTICNNHLDNIDNIYNCLNCNQTHEIPVNGFPINNALMSVIKNANHLNQTQKIAFESFNKLNDKYLEHKSMNSESLIDDYYSKIRNKVDLHRELLIEEINKKSDQILMKLTDLENKCKENSKNLSKIKLNDSEKDECRDKVRQPNLDESATRSLITKMNGLSHAIQNDIERYRNESLMNQNVEFVSENNKLFGELIVGKKVTKAENQRPAISSNASSPSLSEETVEFLRKYHAEQISKQADEQICKQAVEQICKQS